MASSSFTALQVAAPVSHLFPAMFTGEGDPLRGGCRALECGTLQSAPFPVPRIGTRRTPVPPAIREVPVSVERGEGFRFPALGAALGVGPHSTTQDAEEFPCRLIVKVDAVPYLEPRAFRAGRFRAGHAPTSFLMRSMLRA